MAKNERTSGKVATIASQVLAGKKTTPAPAQTVAGPALAQTKGKKESPGCSPLNGRIGVSVTRFVMERRTNEGTASPYMARLVLGVYEMRDMIISHVLRKDHYVWRDHFDDLYAPVQDAMISARNHSARVVG